MGKSFFSIKCLVCHLVGNKVTDCAYCLMRLFVCLFEDEMFAAVIGAADCNTLLLD